MIQEVLILHVGAAVAKAILKVWLGDSGVGTFGTSAVDIISKLGIELSSRRKLERDFHQIADRVGETLFPFFEMEGSKISVASQEAIALALARSISNVNLDPIALVSSFDLRSSKVASEMLRIAKNDLRDFTAAEQALFERLTVECASYIIEISTRLPAFSPAVFGELLQRQQNIDAIAAEVLTELRKLKETSTFYNTEEEMAKFERRYRPALSHRHDEVELFGLDAPSKIRRQNLSVAYVTLSMTKKTSLRHRFRSLIFQSADLLTAKFSVPGSVPATRGPAESRAVSAARIGKGFSVTYDSLARWWQRHVPPGEGTTCDSIVAASPRLLIRGEAGSGKTTLLQWIAVSISSQRLQGPLVDFNVLVPFFVKLRDYAEIPLPSPTELLQRAVPEIADSMPPKWPDYLLTEGRAIILIDGIDELDSVKREAVREWVRGLVNSYPKCRYLLTCRPTAVEENWLTSSTFEEAELLPMGWADIDNLVDHWHAAIGTQSSAPDSQAELLSIASQLKLQLRQNRALSDLATSPLLCAMLCALHYEKQQQLPPNRIGLYEAAIKMLLDQRDRARGITSLKLPALNQEQKRAFLEQLAYWMLRNGLAITTVDEAKAEIERTLPVVKGIPDGSTPSAIVELLVQRSGIIRSPAEGYIDFVHKTFQEFLGAQAIVDRADLHFLVDLAHEDKWYETAILAAGLAPLTQRDEFLTSLIARGRKVGQHRQKLFLLAVACLETAVKLSPEVEALIDRSIREVIPPRNMTEAHALKAAGSLAVPRLERRSSFSAREAAASVRALSLIGGEDALRTLESYSTDNRKTVVRELLSGWGHFDERDYAQRVLANSSLYDGALSIESSARIELMPLLKKLKHLEIQNVSDVTRIDTVGNLVNLTGLSLFNLNQLSSLDSLKDLSALRSLVLVNLPLVNNIKFVRHLSELSYLVIFGAPALEDISGIDEARGLETIQIMDADFVIKEEARLPPRLKHFLLAGSYVSDCRLFSTSPALETLVFSTKRGTTNLETLDELTALQSLDVGLQGVKDIGFLSHLKELRRLVLKEAGDVDDLSPLYSLTGTRTLSIDGMKHVDLDQLLRYKTALNELMVSNCLTAEVFPNCSHLNNLREVTLSSIRELRNIEKIRTIPNLKMIRIIDCPEVDDLSVLSDMKITKILQPTTRVEFLSKP